MKFKFNLNSFARICNARFLINEIFGNSGVNLGLIAPLDKRQSFVTAGQWCMNSRDKKRSGTSLNLEEPRLFVILFNYVPAMSGTLLPGSL